MTTNAKSKFFVCATPQPVALTQAEYEALDWVEVKGMGDHGEAGTSTNILTYDTWGDDVVDKDKGMSNAGDPTVECKRIPTDPGQIILRSFGEPGFNQKIATKIRKADGTSEETGTCVYNRGVVGGPTRPNGRNEDFDLEVFTLGYVQKEIVVNPT